MSEKRKVGQRGPAKKPYKMTPQALDQRLKASRASATARAVPPDESRTVRIKQAHYYRAVQLFGSVNCALDELWARIGSKNNTTKKAR